MTENTSNIEHQAQILIERAKSLIERHNYMAKRLGLYFNVFEILDRTDDEVKGHSAFLAEVMNPQGRHGQGDNYLNLFFKHLRNENGDIFRDLFTKNPETLEWKVTTEKQFSLRDTDGRMDIILETADTCIIIENKIYAEDQWKQLERYWKYGQYMKLDTYIIYLTLDGKEASNESVGDIPDEGKNRILTLSYREFVDQWLEHCIRASASLPYIRETLSQYRDLIIRLSNGIADKEVIMDIIGQIKDPATLKAALKIEKALPEIKANIQFRFWMKLKQKLIEKLRLPQDKFIENGQFSESLVKQYYLPRPQRYYGLVLPIMEIKEDLQLVVKIELNVNIYYGFFLYNNEKQIEINSNDDKILKVLDIINKMDLGLSETTWARWRHPTKLGDKLNFRDFNESCIKLRDDEEMDRVVNILSDEIEGIFTAFAETKAKLID